MVQGSGYKLQAAGSKPQALGSIHWTIHKSAGRHTRAGNFPWGSQWGIPRLRDMRTCTCKWMSVSTVCQTSNVRRQTCFKLQVSSCRLQATCNRYQTSKVGRETEQGIGDSLSVATVCQSSRLRGIEVYGRGKSDFKTLFNLPNYFCTHPLES